MLCKPALWYLEPEIPLDAGSGTDVALQPGGGGGGRGRGGGGGLRS